MSSSLKWAPIPEGKDLPDELKWALEKRFQFSGDGYIFESQHLGYLQGLADAGVKGAGKLIELIEKYERVRLWLEW